MQLLGRGLRDVRMAAHARQHLQLARQFAVVCKLAIPSRAQDAAHQAARIFRGGLVRALPGIAQSARLGECEPLVQQHARPQAGVQRAAGDAGGRERVLAAATASACRSARAGVRR